MDRKVTNGQGSQRTGKLTTTKISHRNMTSIIYILTKAVNIMVIPKQRGLTA